MTCVSMCKTLVLLPVKATIGGRDYDTFEGDRGEEPFFLRSSPRFLRMGIFFSKRENPPIVTYARIFDMVQHKIQNLDVRN